MNLKGDTIELHQKKTGEPVVIRLYRGVACRLATMPRRRHDHSGRTGRCAYRAEPERHGQTRAQKMGVTGYSIHGLRKNAGNDLDEADGTEREIMARLGHQARRWRRTTPSVPAKKCLRSAVEKLEIAQSGKPKNEQGCSAGNPFVMSTI